MPKLPASSVVVNEPGTSERLPTTPVVLMSSKTLVMLSSESEEVITSMSQIILPGLLE